MGMESKWGPYGDTQGHPRAGAGGDLGLWGPKGSEQGMCGQIRGAQGWEKGTWGSQQGHMDGGGTEKRMGDMGLTLGGYGMGHKGTKLEGLGGGGGGHHGDRGCVQRGGPELGGPRDHPGGCGDGTGDAEGQGWGSAGLS